MLELLRVVLSLAGLLLSTYTDFKERIIPDWLTYGLGAAGLAIAAYISFQEGNPNAFILSLATMVGTFIVAYIFWKLGAWAGGDVKLFTGLAALNPINFFVLGDFLHLSFAWNGLQLFTASSLPLFMFNLFMFSVVMLVPYTALLSLRSLSHPANRKKFIQTTFTAIQTGFIYAGVIAAVQLFTQSANLPWPLIPILLFLSAFVPLFIRALIAGIGYVLILSAQPIADWFLPLLVVVLALEILFKWYGFARVHALSFTHKISALKEGDIPAECISRIDGKLQRVPAPNFKTIINSAKSGDVMRILSSTSLPGEVIADPRAAAGLWPEQINILQAAVRKGEIGDHIQLKASSPFAPAVLLAYVLLQLIGDGPLAWKWH